MFRDTNKAILSNLGYTNLVEGEHRIWDGEAWTQARLQKSKAKTLKLIFTDGSEIETSSDQVFLTPKGDCAAEDIEKKEVILSYPCAFETPFPYRIAEARALDRYDTGLLLGFARNAEKEGENLIFQFKEKDYTLVEEFNTILSKICEYEVETKFSCWGNQTVFGCYGLAPYKSLKVPEEVYKSSEVMRGYLRALFDNSAIKNKMLRIKGVKSFLEEVREILKLFRVRSIMDKGLYIRDTDQFMKNISVHSETLMHRIPKIWDGYQRRSNTIARLWVREVRKTKKTREMLSLTTESKKGIINGVFVRT